MIQDLCLVVLVPVVLVRARSSWRKPAWWATIFATVSVTTYGFFLVSPTDLDHLLGGRNLLTLVRDVAAVAAAWWFHNAIAIERGRPEKRLPPWGMLLILPVLVIPFLMIPTPGPSSIDFVIARLSEPPMWLYCSLYISTMGVLVAKVITLLPGEQTAATRFYWVGMLLLLVGCALELAYLCIAFFRPLDHSFRKDYYYIAQGPFFGGLFVAVLGFVWIVGVRTMWRLLARWTLRLDARCHDDGYRDTVMALAHRDGWTDRHLAVDCAVNVRDRLKLNTQTLSKAESIAFAIVERLLSGRVERTTR